MSVIQKKIGGLIFDNLQDWVELTAWSVPHFVVVFTKFDALLAVAMSAPRSGDTQKLPIDEKIAKAHQLTDGIFNNANVWGSCLSELKYAPDYSVWIGGINLFSNKTFQLMEFTWMQGMHNSNEGCNMLLERTAGALNEGLQMLFVTAQETNTASCVRYAVEV
jgi:hypothetical protein